MQLTASNLVAGASYLIFLSNSVGAAAVTYDPTTFKFPEEQFRPLLKHKEELILYLVSLMELQFIVI